MHKNEQNGKSKGETAGSRDRAMGMPQEKGLCSGKRAIGSVRAGTVEDMGQKRPLDRGVANGDAAIGRDGPMAMPQRQGLANGVQGNREPQSGWHRETGQKEPLDQGCANGKGEVADMDQWQHSGGREWPMGCRVNLDPCS